MARISTLAATLTAKPAGPVASSTRGKSGLAELHAAAASGDVDHVRQLLQEGVAVNGPMGPRLLTALHLAAAAGHPDVVRELLANGADVTARHIIDGTPLLVALSTPAAAPVRDSAPGQVAVAALLLQAGADIFGPASYDVVAHLVVARGNSVLLQRLLAAGCSINQQDASGRTLLHLAVLRNNVEAVGILLAHGAAVDVADEHGWTALCLAAFLRHTALVQQLLAAGGAATAVSKSGQTVLHCLVQCAAGASTAATDAMQTLRDIVQLLVNSGADVNAAGHTGWTPLHVAAMNGSTAAAALFLEYGTDVRALDTSGTSSLQFAVASGHANVVQMLLDAGAEAGSALRTAVLVRRMPIIKLLLQHKGQPPFLDTVVEGFAYALRQQQQDAVVGGILATLLLHFCLLAEKQRALQPSAAVSYLFSRPSVAAANKDRPALSLALLRTWGEDTAEVDAAQEKDLASVKRAAQQAYWQLAAADRAASSAPQPAATPAAAAAAVAAAVTSAAAAVTSPAAAAAVQPATAPRRSARLGTRVAAATAAAAAAAAAARKLSAAKRRAR